ncbi:MAG TPA: hypothetical protein VGB75_02395 [Jatrophihabitans sp.]|uniref:hypothetical protein n=1 Tax=Jatrophihabitans sp. TaxID=1932789 RepID=UPI002F2236E0
MPVTEETDAIELLTQAQALIDQARARLVQAAGEEPSQPVLGSRDLARVQRFGEVAHRHLRLIETQGSMTLGESLAIRRELFGPKVQTTANLFGVKGSGALFHRGTPHAKNRHDADPVHLTEEGKRIAGLWREFHPDAP